MLKFRRYHDLAEGLVTNAEISKSTDPYWPLHNIPPKPEPQIKIDLEYLPDNKCREIRSVINQEEIDEWDACFGKAKIEEWINE